MKFTPGTPGESAIVPDGEDPFECVEAEEKTSDSSGNDMIEVVHKIKDGPKVYDYLVKVPEAAWKLTNFLASIGWDFKPGVELDLDPKNLIGRRGTCIIYTDTYQGKKKNKIADYVVVSSRPGAQPPPPPKDRWR
jgi:hypothetical protein